MNLDNLYYPGKVCNGLQSTKNSDNCQQLLSTASFCSVCKKVALATKEEKKKHVSKTWSGQSVRIMFGPNFSLQF